VAKQGGKAFPCFDYKGSVGGTVPASLGKLTGLRLLDMNRNFLSGELPPKLAGLKDMRAFLLDGNLLSGSFPPWLGSLSRLQQLRLDENKLTGTLPLEIGRVSDPTRVARRINSSFNGSFDAIALAPALPLGQRQRAGRAAAAGLGPAGASALHRPDWQQGGAD
jgi:hypothetical protein